MTYHHLEISPLSRHHWVVRFARQFGEPTIQVHELDGEDHDEKIEPDFPAPTPQDVVRHSAEP